jgi:hypothetical protein
MLREFLAALALPLLSARFFHVTNIFTLLVRPSSLVPAGVGRVEGDGHRAEPHVEAADGAAPLRTVGTVGVIGVLMVR